MKLNPLKDIKPPGYPVQEDKPADLTTDLIPVRWLKTAVMTGAAIFMMLSPPQPLFADSPADILKDNGSGIAVMNKNQCSAHGGYIRITKITKVKVDLIKPVAYDDLRKLTEAEFAKHNIYFAGHHHNVGTKDNPFYVDGYSSKDKIAYKIICLGNYREMLEYEGVRKPDISLLEKSVNSFETKLRQCGIRCACIYINEGFSKESAKGNILKQIDQAVKKLK
ncbi:MAG: hypothetical protein LWY06_07185 [Firmicutes bacterium]|nr:hypothetical protein [Bacillota bacterium]